MNCVDYLNILIKYAFINLSISYLFLKISNYKLLNKKNKIIVFSSCVVISILLTSFSKYINPSSVFIISYLILIFVFNYITKYRFSYSSIVTLVALAISIILYVISIMISLFLFVIIFNLDCNNPIILLFAIFMETLFLLLIFNIKRFKNGISFFNNMEQSYGIAIFLSGIVILIFSNLGKHMDNSIKELYILGLLLIMVSIFIWIKRKITLYYKNLLKQDAINDLQNKLKEEININRNMKSELDTLATINHKYSTRISALEFFVQKTHNNLIKNSKMDDATNLIKGLSEEYSVELLDNISIENRTGILSIDNLLEYFKLLCTKNNISYSVIIKHSIAELLSNVIPINLLEILISDMLNNSIIAINHSSTDVKSILVKFDFSDYIEIRIYDTGIPFEIDTLVKLGKEKITTHKNDGGNGIGFFTTFDTLKKTNGSIIIEEYKENKSKYSKCIIFRFDNRGEYIICSHRYNEIKEQSNGNIIIKPNL